MKKTLLALTATAVLVFSGCGGGGGGTSPLKEPTAKITEENAETIIRHLDINDVTEVAGYQEGGKIARLMKFAAVAVADTKIVAQTFEEECPYGGSLKAVGNEERGGYVIYSNCKVSPYLTVDGRADISIQSDKTVSTLENVKYKINYQDKKIELIINNGKYVENYRTDNVTLEMKGSIESNCIGGVVAFETKSPIVSTYYQPCPQSGKVLYKGVGSTMEVAYNSGGVEITLNGQPYKEYDSCFDIEGGEGCRL